MTERQEEQGTEPSEDAVRARVVAAARREFFLHGLRGVTMSDIADALGMSKKTLYKVFPSKLDLARAVLLQKFGEIESELEQVMSAESDFVTSAQALIATLQRHVEELKPPFWRDIQRDAPELFHLAETRRQNLIARYIGELLKSGRKSGIIRKDVSTDVMLSILIGAVQSVVTPASTAELRLTPKEALTAVVTVFFQGVIERNEGARS